MTAAPELHSVELGTDGPRVAFLHGLFGQGKNWTGIAKGLHDCRVSLVDLPDHGRSDWTSSISYPGMADAVAGLLAPGGPATVVGHSMGGKVAMMLALRQPALVSRLCVVDIAPVGYQEFATFAEYVRGMRALDLDRLTNRAAADRQLAPYVPDPTIRSFLLQNLRRDDTGWRSQLNLQLLGEHLDEVAGWPDVTADPYAGPVLWVAGANSRYVGPASAARMRAYFPRAQLVTVKNAGHWVHADQPAVFLTLLRRFVPG